MNEKLLIFQHVPHEHAGRFIETAQNNDICIDIIKFWESHKIPDLREYAGLLIMGGPQSAYDATEKYPSLRFEVDSIKFFSQIHKPILGVCLGGQLVALALGGKVYPNRVNEKPSKETGFYQVQLTEQGKSNSLFKGFPECFEVFQWHGDVFDLPKEASLLAIGQNVRNQAFVCNCLTYGLLFHLEVTPRMVKELVRADNEWLHKDNPVNEGQIIEQAYNCEQNLRRLNEMLFSNWLSCYF